MSKFSSGGIDDAYVLLVSAILVLSYMPNGPEVIITAGFITAGTTTFSGMLLT